MRPRNLKALWRENKTVINTWLTVPSAWTAELMAHAGFDAITIDMQHGLIDYQVALSMLQAISATEAVPLVRLPWNDPAAIMRMLDAGASGLICPLINTRSDTEAFVGACRFPPRGYRSWGPTRAEVLVNGDYVHSADDSIIALAMVETAEMLENLDEIVRTPGLDGLYVGPYDLSLSLGLTRVADFSDPELSRALDKVLAAAARYNLVPGVHAVTPENAVMLSERGFRFVTVGSDTGLLSAGARDVLTRTLAGVHR